MSSTFPGTSWSCRQCRGQIAWILIIWRGEWEVGNFELPLITTWYKASLYLLMWKTVKTYAVINCNAVYLKRATQWRNVNFFKIDDDLICKLTFSLSAKCINAPYMNRLTIRTEIIIEYLRSPKRKRGNVNYLGALCFEEWKQKPLWTFYCGRCLLE